MFTAASFIFAIAFLITRSTNRVLSERLEFIMRNERIAMLLTGGGPSPAAKAILRALNFGAIFAGFCFLSAVVCGAIAIARIAP